MKRLKRPSILLLYTDQQRFDSLSCDGGPHAVSPNLDRLASQGVRFDGFHVNAVVCTPSRMSLLTGRYCSSIGIGWNGPSFPLGEAVPVNQLLKPYGYETAQIGKLHFDPHARRDHRDPTPTYGFDRFVLSDEPGCYDDAYTKWVEAVAPGKLAKTRTKLPPAAFHYGHPNYNEQERGLPGGYVFEGDEGLTHSSFVASETCRFIEEMGKDAERGRPFFAIAGFYAPHAPLNPPRRFLEMIDAKALPPPRMSEEERARSRYKDTTPQTWRETAAHYYALCAHVDDCVGRILECLERAGRAEETIVIFTSDHGEYLGDHGRTGKGSPGHDCIVHVPFIMRYPGRFPAGKVVTDLVEGVDVVPTLLDYAGVQVPSFVQGRSLRQALEAADPAPREDVFIESFTSPGMGSLPLTRRSTVKTRGFMYSCDDKGDEILCDRTADPGEGSNVVREAACAEALSDMRRRLAIRLQKAAFRGHPGEVEY